MAHERKNLSDQETSRLIANIFPHLIKAITRYCINNLRSQELRTFDQSVTLQALLPGNLDLQTLLDSTAFEEDPRRTPTYGEFTSLVAEHINNLIALNDQYKNIYIALNETARKYRDIITPINIANWSAHYVGTTLELIKVSLNDAEIKAEMNSKGLPYEILIAPLISIFNLTTSAKLQRGSHQVPPALMAAARRSRQTSASTSQASNGRESSSLGRESMLDLLVANFGRSAHSLADQRTSLRAASAATLSTPSGPDEIERMMIRMNTGRYTARVQRSDYMQNIFMPYTHSSNEQKNLAQSQRSIYEGISLFCFNPCSIEEKKTQDNLAPEQDMWDEQDEKPPREIWRDGAQLEEILRQLNAAATAFDSDKNLSTLIKTTIEQLWNIGEWKTLLVEKNGELLDLPLVKGAIARLLKAITSHQNTPPILQVLQPAIVEVLYDYFEHINAHAALAAIIPHDLETAIKQVISLPALQGAIESKEADAEMDGDEALASAATSFLELVKSSDATVQEVQEWHQASAPLFQKDHEPQLLLRPPVMEEKFPRDEAQLRQHVRAHFALQLANLHDIGGIDFEEQVSEILIEQQRLENITQVLLKNHEALSEILKDNQDIEAEVREFLNTVVSTDGRNNDPQHVFQELSDKPQYHLAIIQIINDHWSQLTPPYGDQAKVTRCQALLLSPKQSTIQITKDALKQKKETREAFVIIAQQAFLKDEIATKVKDIPLPKDRAAILKNYVMQLAQACFSNNEKHQVIFADCLLLMIKPICDQDQPNTSQGNLERYAKGVAPAYDIKISMLTNHRALCLLEINADYGGSDLPDITSGNQERRENAAKIFLDNPEKAQAIIKKYTDQETKILGDQSPYQKFQKKAKVSTDDDSTIKNELKKAIKNFVDNIGIYRHYVNPIEGFIQNEVLPELQKTYLIQQPWTDGKVKIYELIRQFLPVALAAIVNKTKQEDIPTTPFSAHAVSQQLQRQLALTILLAHKNYFLEPEQTHPDLKIALKKNESAVYEFLLQYDGAADNIIDHYRKNKAVMAKEDKATIGRLLSREYKTHQETNNYTALAGSFARWQVLAYNNEEQAKEVANKVTLHPPFTIAENFPVLVTNCPDLLDFPGDSDQAVLTAWVNSKVVAFQKLFNEFLDDDKYIVFIRAKALNENISFDQAHKNVCSNYLNSVFSQLSTVTDISSDLKNMFADRVINEVTAQTITNDPEIFLDLKDGVDGEKAHYIPIASIYIYPDFFTPEVYESIGINPEEQDYIRKVIATPPKKAFVALMGYLKENPSISTAILEKIGQDYEKFYACYDQDKGQIFLQFYFQEASISLPSEREISRFFDAGNMCKIARPKTLSIDYINKFLTELNEGKPLDLSILKLLKNLFTETIDTIQNLATEDDLTRTLAPYPKQSILQFIGALFASIMPGVLQESYYEGSKEHALSTLLAKFFNEFNKAYILGGTNSPYQDFVKGCTSISAYKKYFLKKIDQLIISAEKNSGRLIPENLSKEQREFLNACNQSSSAVFVNAEENFSCGFFDNLLILALEEEKVALNTQIKPVRIHVRNKVNDGLDERKIDKQVEGYIGYCRNLQPRSIYNIISKKLFDGADAELSTRADLAYTDPNAIEKIKSLFEQSTSAIENEEVDYISARIYLAYVLAPELNSLENNLSGDTLLTSINELLNAPDSENDQARFITQTKDFISAAYSSDILGTKPDYMPRLRFAEPTASTADTNLEETAATKLKAHYQYTGPLNLDEKTDAYSARIYLKHILKPLVADIKSKLEAAPISAAIAVEIAAEIDGFLEGSNTIDLIQRANKLIVRASNEATASQIETLYQNGSPLSLNEDMDYYSARIYLEYVLVPRLEASQDNNHCAALAAEINHLLAQPNAENDTKSFIKRANKFIGRAYQQNVLGPAPAYINKLYLEQQIQSAKDRSESSSRNASRSQESNGSTTSSSTGSHASSDREQTGSPTNRSLSGNSRINSISTDSANSASKTERDIGKSIIRLVPGDITLPPAIKDALKSNNYQQAGIEAQAYLDKNVFAMFANKKQLRLLAAIATFKDCFPGRNPQPVFAQFLTTTKLWPRFLEVQDDEGSQFRLPPGAICNAWLYKESKNQLESYQVEGSTITFQQHCVNAIEAIINADALTADGQELAWFLEGVTAPDELNQIAENQDPRNIINDHISYALNQLNASPQGPKLNYDQTIKIIELIGTTLARKYLLDEKQQKRAINYYKKPQNLLALANTNVGPNALPNYFKHDYIDYRILGKFINPEVRQKTPPISTKINLDNFLTKYPGFENINTELTDKADYFLPILQRLLSHSYFNEHGNEKTKFIKHYFESLKVFPQTERDFKCNFMLDILSSYFSANVEALQHMEAVPDQQEIAITILRTDKPQEIQQHFKDHWLTIKGNRPTDETVEQLKPGIKEKLPASREKIYGVLERKRTLIKDFWKEFITPEIAKEFIGKNVYVITDYLIESFKHYCANHIETLSAEQQKIFIENFSEIFYYIANSATQSELTTRQVGCRYKSYKNASSADTEETSRDYNNAIIELDFAKDATKPVPVDAKTFANIVAIAIAKVIERNLDLTKGNVQRALPISKFKLSADASKEDYFQELNQQVATCFKIYTTRYPAKNKPEEHNKGLLKDIGLSLFEQSQPGKKPAAAQVESDPSSEAVTTGHAYHMPADAAMLSSEKTVTAIQHSLQNNGWSDTALNAYMKALSPATSANAVANDQDELVREAARSDDEFEEAAKRLKGYIEANCLAKMKGGISLYGRPAATGMRQIIKALENTALTKEQITTLTQAFSAARLTITRGCLSGPRTKETTSVYEKLSKAKTPQAFIDAVNELVPKPPTPSTDAAVVPNQG